MISSFATYFCLLFKNKKGDTRKRKDRDRRGEVVSGIKEVIK